VTGPGGGSSGGGSGERLAAPKDGGSGKLGHRRRRTAPGKWRWPVAVFKLRRKALGGSCTRERERERRIEGRVRAE
jgi:hypothetical protein